MTDTGPPYPRPIPGSNQIGPPTQAGQPVFTIGVSPIGTISPFDVWTTIVSQYGNSDILDQLIVNFASYLDQTVNFDQFFDLMFNVDTAQGYGLDVWGRIVGVVRTLKVPLGRFFGFQEGGADFDPFNQSPFYAGFQATQNYQLSDNAFRTLILAKAFANITLNSIPAMNQMLMTLFPGRGNCYVTEGNPAAAPWFGFEEATDAQPFNQAPFFTIITANRMNMTYTFEFLLQPFELAIMNSGVLPKPAGVNATIVQKL